MSLESGVMLCRLNHELLPDPGNPMARTTVPLEARGAAAGVAFAPPAVSIAGSGDGFTLGHRFGRCLGGRLQVSISLRPAAASSASSPPPSAARVAVSGRALRLRRARLRSFVVNWLEVPARALQSRFTFLLRLYELEPPGRWHPGHRSRRAEEGPVQARSYRLPHSFWGA